MKTAIMFSGQGSQYVGMVKDLYDEYATVREIFDQADKILDFKITEICFNENENLNLTKYTQPAILTASYAIYNLIKDEVKPNYFLGLSLGEYTALIASGVVSFEEGLKLISKRALYMHETCQSIKGYMTAVISMDTEVVKQTIDEVKAGYVTCANFNYNGQIVIAGDLNGIEEAEALLKEKGARKLLRLNVAGAFHSKLFEDASVKLNAELKSCNFKKFNTPVISNLTAKEITKDELVENLTNQVKSSVLWDKSIEYAIANGVSNFIEIGPGKALSGFVKKIDKTVSVCNIENIDTYNAFINN